MEWSNKILSICDHYRLSVSEFASKIGIPRGAALSYTREGAIKQPAKPPIDLAPLVLKAFPEINVEWFLFGNGPMILNNNTSKDNAIENMFEETKNINESALQLKYTQVLEDLNEARKELIQCLKGHPDGLPPLTPRKRVHG